MASSEVFEVVMNGKKERKVQLRRYVVRGHEFVRMRKDVQQSDVPLLDHVAKPAFEAGAEYSVEDPEMRLEAAQFEPAQGRPSRKMNLFHIRGWRWSKHTGAQAQHRRMFRLEKRAQDPRSAAGRVKGKGLNECDHARAFQQEWGALTAFSMLDFTATWIQGGVFLKKTPLCAISKSSWRRSRILV
jgi:hypothetical protein